MDRTIRFVHTSDIHLDTSFAGSAFPSRLGHRKREAIRATFRRILQEAHRNQVDLVLIAGDLFEHDRVLPDTVEFLKRQFEELEGIPVFISPGNHDPYLSGSPYHEEIWPPNVHVFREEKFTSVELSDIGVRVTGFGFNRTRVSDRGFSLLGGLPRDGTNFVVSHASDLSRVPEGKARHMPFRIEELAGKNIHYCALGHYHEQRQVANPVDDTAVWYSGIPEGRSWSETGECGYLAGAIEGGRVRVERAVCSQFPLEVLTLPCDGFSTREQVIDAVRQQRGSSPDTHTILRVRLVGSADPRLDLSTAEMGERLAEEALYIQWIDETVPQVDFDSLAGQDSLTGAFVRELNERLASAASGERELLERARIYGLRALQGREVRPR